MTYANAGHPPPILRRTGSNPQLLAPTGPLISSALIDVPCRDGNVSLSPHDCLFCYTDGLTEAHGPEGYFGEDRLISLIGRNGMHGRDEVDRILSSISDFTGARPFQDDITLLSLALHG